MGVCSSEVVDQDEADLAREQEEAAAEAASQQRDDMEAAAETMLLKITDPAPGTTVEIRVSATVSDLKRKLGASYGIDRESAAHLKILFVGEVLSEETRLDQTALCQGAEIKVEGVLEAATAAAASVDVYEAAAGGDMKALEVVARYAPERIDEVKVRAGGDKQSALWRAVRQGVLPAVQALVEARADVNKPMGVAPTPLLWAAASGHCSIVQALLVAPNAVIAQTSSSGETALQMAATNGHCSVVQMLIEHSADVNTADDEGRTPLHSAADNADVNVVRALLCAKADVSVTDKMGDTPLDFAEEAENEDAAEEVQKMLQDASEE